MLYKDAYWRFIVCISSFPCLNFCCTISLRFVNVFTRMSYLRNNWHKTDQTGLEICPYNGRIQQKGLQRLNRATTAKSHPFRTSNACGTNTRCHTFTSVWDLQVLGTPWTRIRERWRRSVDVAHGSSCMHQNISKYSFIDLTSWRLKRPQVAVSQSWPILIIQEKPSPCMWAAATATW